MAVDSILINPEDGTPLHYVPSQVGTSHSSILVVETAARAHGLWTAATVTTASTTILTQPLTGGSIIITDVVLSAKKKTAATVLVQFTDGSNTSVLLAPDIVNAPANISWSPQGLIRGWMDARIELVTDASFDCTLTIGYIKTLTGETFATWAASK
jgi:hypothetical protein